MLLRPFLLAAGAALVLTISAPAQAHWDDYGWRRETWREHAWREREARREAWRAREWREAHRPAYVPRGYGY